MVFASQEVVLQLYAGGGAQDFPCQVLVKSLRLINYCSESIAGGGGQSSFRAFLLFSRRNSGVASV